MQKMQKMHQILVHFFGGHFDYKIGLKMRCSAKMLAADRSNANYLDDKSKCGFGDRTS